MAGGCKCGGAGGCSEQRRDAGLSRYTHSNKDDHPLKVLENHYSRERKGKIDVINNNDVTSFFIAISVAACGPSALYNAAYRGNNGEVISLLASGENINEKGHNGWASLMIAAAGAGQ